jgi:peptidoglycan/xylan/chitin deacetylase (PgdA/CDA1 family)
MAVLTALGKFLLMAWLGLGMVWPGFQVTSETKATAPDAGPPLMQAQTTVDPAPVVYLTFDDGPHPVYTPQVLDLLAEYNVRATFFVVGWMVSQFPDVTRRIKAEGHSIQLHSWRHDDLTKFTRGEFITDTYQVQAILRETVNLRGTCIRPPYGSVNDRVRGWASELDLSVAMWDVSGQDWTGISADRIARIVLQRVGPEAVVLLHDGGGPRHRTVSALEEILSELTDDGYEFEVMCHSLYLPEPHPPCWIAGAWPEPRPCEEFSTPTVQ